jgi:hypothetical protein
MALLLRRSLRATKKGVSEFNEGDIVAVSCGCMYVNMRVHLSFVWPSTTLLRNIDDRSDVVFRRPYGDLQYGRLKDMFFF